VTGRSDCKEEGTKKNYQGPGNGGEMARLKAAPEKKRVVRGQNAHEGSRREEKGRSLKRAKREKTRGEKKEKRMGTHETI